MAQWFAIALLFFTQLAHGETPAFSVSFHFASDHIFASDQIKIFSDRVEINTAKDARASRLGTIGKFILKDKTMVELLFRSTRYAKEESQTYTQLAGVTSGRQYYSLMIDGKIVENDSAAQQLIPVLEMARNHPQRQHVNGESFYILKNGSQSVIRSTLHNGKVTSTQILPLAAAGCQKYELKKWSCRGIGEYLVLLSE